DRPADVWEPLLAVADAVGGHWPDRARQACVTLVKASEANDKGSLGVRLLTDLRDHVMLGIDRLPTVAILDRLNALDDAPWADLNGKPLDNRRLSRMLAEYMTADNEPIASRNIKTAGSVLKGYYATDLHDAWQRYCPPPPESPLLPLPGTENTA
ncbi:DNA primase, partial [Streptomyces leeuwenhoekii]